MDTVEQSFTERNIVQTYFNEINSIYKKNNNNYDIEYCPENREKLISMNLKSVIYIAKKYQNMGLSLDELISAGNLGLCIAFDKFDPSRNKLKQQALDSLNTKSENIPYDDMTDIFELISYGDLSEKFAAVFPKADTYNRDKLIAWVERNIFSAKFNSVAAMWIKAYILLEIDNCSRLVKKPKSEILKDKEETKSYQVEVLAELDDSCDVAEYDNDSDVETIDAYNTFKNNLNLLLTDVSQRDRGIIMKKFGIGLPRPMLPKEIAEREGLSIARISQIIQHVVEKMQMNQLKYNIDKSVMYEALQSMTM